jgi:hypothetical protein
MAAKTYRCSECGVEFDTRDKLDDHSRRDHSGMQKRDMSGTERGGSKQMGESERGGQWGPGGGERGQTGTRGGQQGPGRSSPGQSAAPDDL